MTLEKYNEIWKAALVWAEATETGCRNQRNQTEKLILDAIKIKCHERHQNSKYVVYGRYKNYGTIKYPDICYTIDIVPLDVLRKQKSHSFMVQPESTRHQLLVICLNIRSD